MTDLAVFKTRILQLLGDTAGARFPEERLKEALRQALAVYSQALPQVLETEITLTAAGREQSLVVSPAPLFVIKLIRGGREMPFQFFVRSGQPVLVIGGDSAPVIGDEFNLRYAAGHGVKDLDAATDTSIPAGHESVVVRGAAGFAALLRLAGVGESYGSRTVEAAHLAEIGKQWLGDFQQALERLRRAERMHEYPAGFALDGKGGLG